MRSERKQFAALGIAQDTRAADGLAHLEKFGPFDEVMSGHGWAGHVSIADERVLVRKAGLDKISEWVRAGAPIQLEPGHP